jgi:hypothetical protein
VARLLTKKPYIGQRYMVPVGSNEIQKKGMNKRHNMYRENLDTCLRNALQWEREERDGQIT